MAFLFSERIGGGRDQHPPAGAARGATWCWVVGGVEAALFGCCASIFTVAGLLPDEVLREPFQSVSLPPGTTIQSLRMGMIVVAVLQVLVLVLPGLALVALGFLVWKGSEGARRAARAILFAQAAMVGLLLVLNIGKAVVNAQLAALPQVLVLGGLVALQVTAYRALAPGLVPRPALSAYDDYEPWNNHLPR